MSRQASGVRCARGTRRIALVMLAGLLFLPSPARAQPLPIIDVPFISQTEALCGGAAAAMVLRFWGERSLTADSFAALVDRSASGIRTNVLASDIERRGFSVAAGAGSADQLREWLRNGWPIIALIEDRPGTYHYVVIVAWHERGVIVHDPARAPFQVMQVADFERRWRRAGRWMLLALRRAGDESAPPVAAPIRGGTPVAGARAIPPAAADATCGELVDEGVRLAQAAQLAAAEQQLARALGCPGGAAARELAGIRLLQRRWPEVATLATQALDANPSDSYAWKLLGTARFVANDTGAALDAWNHAGEPTVDIVRVEGLARTRQRVVERLMDVAPGDLLTSARLRRAQRQLSELPSAGASAVSYVPAASGRAEMRAALVERSVAPHGAAAAVSTAVAAAVRREVEVGLSSLSGGGERVAASWRFWPHRPRYALDLRAPAPWGGVWDVSAAYERQPFTSSIGEVERSTAELGWATWLTDVLRVNFSGGLDHWRDRPKVAAIGVGIAVTSPAERIEFHADGRGWLGGSPFGAWQTTITARTSRNPEGIVGFVSAAASRVSDDAPFNLWVAGDTGHARSILLRAHPLLDDGRIRTDQLGRTIVASTLEAQRWRAWGPVRLAIAAFTDIARTSDRLAAPPLVDVDAGAGVRLAPLAMPGTIRIDVAKGLRDGATAVSLVYER